MWVCVYIHTTSSLSVEGLIICCWLWSFMLLWILGCMYLFELVLFSSDMYHGMKFLDLYCSSFFSFLRGLHLVFHNGCTNLHSYKQFLHRKKGFSPHSHQHLLFVVSLIITILTNVRDTYLICISLISNVEHLFTCLLTIWNSPLEECLSAPLPIFKFPRLLIEECIFSLFLFLLLLS